MSAKMPCSTVSRNYISLVKGKKLYTVGQSQRVIETDLCTAEVSKAQGLKGGMRM